MSALMFSLIQLCPDQHPTVGSVTLWGTIQNYPACPVAPRFADEGHMKFFKNWAFMYRQNYKNFPKNV
jgi:hypothetical protein